MEDQKQHVIDSLKQGTNILVTVKSSPSIDELAACIALTLIMNELGKHGTAVFSGQVPSVLEFLEPEKTLQRNTDSLQDFIISLDKSKADKLRYKVEDKVVKIFITPYRTSLSSKDLEFGQGDFNVDVVVALGVHEQNDLDEAITAHGRILHDATVISINTSGDANKDLGSLNWTDENVSSLSELIAEIADQLGEVKDKDSNNGSVIDNQIATALLTGIVAETERFGNAKTKPATMEAAAKLLAAGANQELVADKLSEPEPTPPAPAPIESQPLSLQDGNNESVSYTIPGTEESNTPPLERANDQLQEPVAPPESQPPQDESFSVNSDGELSITHPYGEEPEPEKPASEPVPSNDAFKEPSGSLPPVMASEGQVPPIYEPGQPGPNNGPDNNPDSLPPPPPNPPSFPDSPPASEPPAGQGEPGEERAALDYLKERQISPANTRVLAPLHDKEHLAEGLSDAGPAAEDGMPHIGPAKAEPQESAPPKLALAGNKYALTPPSFGGALTANLPTEDTGTVDTPVAPVSRGSAPMLTHEKPKGLPVPSVPPSTPPPASAPAPVTPSSVPLPVVPVSRPELTPTPKAAQVPVVSLLPPPAAAPPIPIVPPTPKVAAPAAGALHEPVVAPPVVERTQPQPPELPELAPEPPAQPQPPIVQAPKAQPSAPTGPPKLEAALAPAPAKVELPKFIPEPAVSPATDGTAPKLEAALAPDSGAGLPPPSVQPQPSVPATPSNGKPQVIQATPLEPAAYQEAAKPETAEPKAFSAGKDAPGSPKLEAALDTPAGAHTALASPAIKLPSPQTVSATGASTVSPLAPPPPVPPPLAAQL